MEERSPADGIRRHREMLDGLSDEDFLARLLAVPALPQTDDDDPAWGDDATWDRAEELLAFADAIGDRRLVEAIAPLYERAALGGGFGMMPDLRHGPERAVAPEWQRLVEIMIPLVDHPNPGCRRWAVRELGILRNPTSLPALLAAAGDPEPWVRQEACTSLGMVAERAQPSRTAVRERLLSVADADDSQLVRAAATWAARNLEQA